MIMTVVDAAKSYKYYFLLCLLLLAGAYHSIVSSMIQDWYTDGNYSHGFLVPIVAGYFLYERLEELKGAVVEPWSPGIIVVVAGIIALTVGWLGTEYFTMRSSLIVILSGMVLYFFGKEAFKTSLLPILYLIFMVPIPYIIYDAAAFPLKLFVTKVSVGFLKAIGVVVLREGNIIMFPATTLEVADACSGIRSLISLIALAVAFAYFTRTTNLKRWVIIVSAVPIAILTNATRVIATGILAQYWGARAAEGFFHEFAGVVVFGLALAILVTLGVVLKGKEGKR